MTTDVLSITFSALADPTRRAILARLALGESSVTEIARPFKISLPAVTKHLKVLERSGLIARSRAAQWRPCRLKAKPMKEAVNWLEHYRRHWEERFDRLDDYLLELQGKKKSKRRRKNMTTGKNDLTEAPADRSLVITRIFDAPRRLVFEAWTKKEHLDQWCAPRGVTIPFSEGDFRPGGAWRCCMVGPDKVKLWLGGVYREIVQDELLVFTHVWEEDDGKPGHETVVKVRFEDEGKKTKVTLEQTNFKSVESRDGHNGGWSSALEILAEHLEKLQTKE